MTEVYYKVRQVLQYTSSITKCDRLLLEIASGITKYDRLLLESASGITKCDSYYKVRCDKIISKCFLTFESFLSKYKFFEVAAFFLA